MDRYPSAGSVARLSVEEMAGGWKYGISDAKSISTTWPKVRFSKKETKWFGFIGPHLLTVLAYRQFPGKTGGKSAGKQRQTAKNQPPI